MSTEASPSSSRMRTIGIPVLWVVSVVLAYLLGAYGTPGQQPAPAAAPPAAAPAEDPQAPEAMDPALEKYLRELPRRQGDDPLALGKTDAKVVMTVWSDYRCPFCSLWHKQTLPQLQRYVDDGTLRIEFRDLAIFGEQSTNAAVAGRAAGKQGKFWEFSDVVAEAAPESGHPDIDKADLLAFARKAGVKDLAKFEKDLADPALAKAVATDSAEAQQIGISGTPFFVVGLTPISGAQPVTVFTQAIEAEAKR